MNFNFPSKLDPAKCVLAKWELQNESLPNMINIRQTIYCFSPPQNMAQKFNHWSFLCLKIFIAEPSHQPWEVIFNIFLNSFTAIFLAQFIVRSSLSHSAYIPLISQQLKNTMNVLLRTFCRFSYGVRDLWPFPTANLLESTLEFLSKKPLQKFQIQKVAHFRFPINNLCNQSAKFSFFEKVAQGKRFIYH